MTAATFITGNQNKADYLAKMLGMPIAHQKLVLDEVQAATVKEVVEHKVRQAYDILNKPVIVDDVGLGYTALGGLPGPFIKFFVEKPGGMEMLCRMLDGFADRSATVESVIGYYDGERLELFRGVMNGTIATSPGEPKVGWDWDVVFCPDGYNGRIRSELSQAEYDESYSSHKPFDQLRKFLTSL